MKKLSKFQKFMDMFIAFYTNKSDETYLCIAISDFKRKHPFLTFYFSKELSKLHYAILGGLCIKNTFNLYSYNSSSSYSEEKNIRITWLLNLQRRSPIEI